MFLTQIIGCITGALVVAVLWLGVELHGVKREARELRDDVAADLDTVWFSMEGRDDRDA